MMTIILSLGIINFMLILFQLLTGYHIIKTRLKIHKLFGWILAATAVLHGLLAILTHD